MRSPAICGAVVAAAIATMPASAVITSIDFHGPGIITKATGVYRPTLRNAVKIDGYIIFDMPIADNFTGSLYVDSSNSEYSTPYFGSDYLSNSSSGTLSYLKGNLTLFEFFYDNENFFSVFTDRTFALYDEYDDQSFFSGIWKNSDDPNVSPLPEPSIWAALTVGFLITGLAVRSSRTTARRRRS